MKRTRFLYVLILYVRMGSDGHGIGRTWDRTDMGSLLGSTWPSVGFLLRTNGHGIGRTWDPFWDWSYLPYPLISEAWLGGLAISHVLHLTLVGRAKKYRRTVQKYVCTVQYLGGLRQWKFSEDQKKSTEEIFPEYPEIYLISKSIRPSNYPFNSHVGPRRNIW